MFYPIVFVPCFLKSLSEVLGLFLIRSIRAAYSSDTTALTYRETFNKWTWMKAVTSKEGIYVRGFPIETCREGGFVVNNHHTKKTDL
jgi:hypothetical protein